MKNRFFTLLFLLCLCGYTLHAQIITTIAGKDSVGFSGDDGPATMAKLHSPHDLVVYAGNVYITDQSNNRVRMISPAGLITTIAGNGTAGFLGDGDQATAAELNLPTGLAVDNSGNLYIADQSNYRIRKVSPSGIISTVAGNGVFTYTGDNVQATATGLFPNAVAVDNAGNLYITELSNYRARMVNTSGIISTLAGTGIGGYSGDGGPATDAQIGPAGIGLDNRGNIYIADVYNNLIRIINPSGIINTFAGAGAPTYSGDGGPATAANIQAPQCVRADTMGNIYIADNFNACIRKVDTAGIITTIAGIDTAGFRGDNGPATAAELNAPTGVFVDSSGLVYIADNFNNRIRKIAPPVLQPITGIFTLCPGSTVTLSNATSGGTWSSSSTAVATVGSSTGIVSGVANGTATITYSIYDSTVSAVVTIDCPTGINTLNYKDNDLIKIFPNPNDGAFAFELFSINQGEVHLIITNAIGQKIKEVSVQTNTEVEMQIEVPPGMYFVNAVTEQGSQNIKISVQ